jgi:pimeloyl-ACP methyl ester carboxylesterase
MHVSRPSDLLYATDPARALVELLTWPLSLQLLRGAPRGSGQPVLVLPGLLAGDFSTRPLRAFLHARGFGVHGWLLGRNLGPTPAVEAGLRTRLALLAGRYDAPVAVVGWSLGGIYARAVAAERPDLVSQVITLGTPFAMVDAGQTRAQDAYNRYAHLHAPGRGLPVPAEVSGPLPVPATSIWSRHDGIVAWQASLAQASPTAENIAVHSSHLGLGHSPAVLWAVADRLAQPAGRWRPFSPPSRLRQLYPAVPDSSPVS